MSDTNRNVSRRSFLHRLSFAAAAGSLLASCRSEANNELRATTAGISPGKADEFACTDVSNLTEEQIQIRKSLQYVDDTPHAEKPCDGCQLFKPPASGKECGTCQVVPGPIHPQGYCTAWSAAV